MKKKLAVVIISALVALTAFAQTPKYVFYFIGDGMGVNQVGLTEMFNKALATGEFGCENLNFSNFPVATFATHYSASSDVTDSAASGTALATGTKTINGYLGVDVNEEPLTSIAARAKASGKKVAIMSTVGVNHATPGAFYAHQPSRNMYYQIALDMIPAGFDFYSGSNVIEDDRLHDGTPMAEPATKKIAEAGYTVCNYAEFEECYKTAEKVLVNPSKGEKVQYAIDAQYTPENQRITLKKMVESSVKFLMKDGCKNGFFLMAEGGKIDGACHSHDAGTTVNEVKDLAEAVQVAIDFYNKYPKQTLIVITADHETGGLIYDCKKPEELALLANQKHSINVISGMLKDKMKNNGKPLTWEETKAFLTEQFGLWDSVPVKWEQEKSIRDLYETTVAKNKAGHEKDLYSDNAKIVAAAAKIFYKNIKIHWVDSHSSGYVPVYALGAGSSSFSHKTDNAEIAKTIATVAKYK